MEKRVLFFTSPTCYSSSHMRPLLLMLQEKHKFKVTVQELRRDNIAIFDVYGVRMVPTLILIDESNGKALARHSGMTEKLLLDRLLVEWGLIR